MTHEPDAGRGLWRVGYHADPLGFAPRELYEFSHRFDDAQRRFRTLYCAELPETYLREVLADFRPNLAALRRHVERYGPEAADDFASEPITARWRTQHVPAPLRLELAGPVVDLIDCRLAKRSRIATSSYCSSTACSTSIYTRSQRVDGRSPRRSRRRLAPGLPLFSSWYSSYSTCPPASAPSFVKFHVCSMVRLSAGSCFPGRV